MTKDKEIILELSKYSPIYNKRRMTMQTLDDDNNVIGTEDFGELTEILCDWCNAEITTDIVHSLTYISGEDQSMHVSRAICQECFDKNYKKLPRIDCKVHQLVDEAIVKKTQSIEVDGIKFELAHIHAYHFILYSDLHEYKMPLLKSNPREIFTILDKVKDAFKGHTPQDHL